MKNLFALLASCSFLVMPSLFAADAVAVGYNADGVWTAVTYYASSTPKGGADYKDVAEARKAAVHDLHERTGDNMVLSDVIADSDSTGYVAVARGEKKGDKDATVVAHAKSQREADQKALADLSRRGATKKQKIVYRYFSYGSDAGN